MALVDYLADLEALRRRGSREAGDAQRALATLITRGEAIGQALARYETGETGRVAVPFAELLALSDAIDAFCEAYFDALDVPEQLFADLRAAQHHLLALDILQRAFVPAAGADPAGDGTTADDRPLVPYRLRQGDTLEGLAIAFLGDMDRVDDIIALNGLVYPFLDTQRSLRPAEFEREDFSDDFTVDAGPDRAGVPDGVAVTGDVLRLPADATIAADDRGTPLDVELYGRDLLVRDGQVQWTVTGDDLDTVEALDNVEYALRNRIATTRGELVLHPDYGIETLLAVGIEGTRSNVVFQGLLVGQTVRQDPRVTRIDGLEMLFENTTNQIGMRVGLIGPGQRALPLNVVLP